MYNNLNDSDLIIPNRAKLLENKAFFKSMSQLQTIDGYISIEQESISILNVYLNIIKRNIS